MMKNSPDGSSASPVPNGGDEFVSRKLIRPSLGPQNRSSQSYSQDERTVVPRAPRGVAADSTHAETFYYQKQIQSRTPICIQLRNGESVEGILEWYDKGALRLTRRDQPNLVIYKSAIKYIYKSGEIGQK
jgi:sRNA-binding regulator protein Hfq